MKKYTILILILLTITPILGFGKENPEDVLINYLKALYSNNLKKTYKYISKTDQNTISRNEFIKQNSLDDPFLQEMAKTIYSLSKYEVNEVNTNEDNSIVDVTIIAPDMPKVLGEIFGPFQGPTSMKNPQEAMRHMLRQYLKKGNVPMEEDNRKFTLVKEDGKWKVFIGLKSKD
ncbi:MAG: hypothetical protein ACE5KZ_12085 [Candidatus Scalinduaceae bacterium]